mmetsp:Transcript_25935/g.43141  ORF Transcript_25935/g.43141 Transcript_25935/m.43141 type:complete len:222 (+) Transcript_25935:583-1248(+)
MPASAAPAPPRPPNAFIPPLATLFAVLLFSPRPLLPRALVSRLILPLLTAVSVSFKSILACLSFPSTFLISLLICAFCSGSSSNFNFLSNPCFSFSNNSTLRLAFALAFLPFRTSFLPFLYPLYRRAARATLLSLFLVAKDLMRAVTEALGIEEKLLPLTLMGLRLSKGVMFILDLLDDDVLSRRGGGRGAVGVMVFLRPRRPAMMYTVFLFVILKFITIA